MTTESFHFLQDGFFLEGACLILLSWKLCEFVINYMNSKITFIVFGALAALGLIIFFSVRTAPPANDQQNGMSTLTFSETGNLVRNNPGMEANVWYLVYEKPGQPGLSMPLYFNQNSNCRTGTSTSPCDPSQLQQGTRAEVKGSQDAAGVRVNELVFMPSPSVNNFSIKLYYYNPALDQGPGGAQCSSQGLVAVERVIPRTTTPIQDTVRLLLRGEISDEEKALGITSEFPLSGVALRSASLANGTLTLTFDDLENRTGGGSCRVNILWKQIEATAKQFGEVRAVRFMPEELFQP